MPAQSLRCRVCETRARARAVRRLLRVLRAARSRLRLGRAARVVHARDDRGRPALASGATRRSCRSMPPAEPRLAPGFTPLLPAPRLASALGLGELHLKLDTANPTHSFKDRVVAVAAAKALELGATRSPAPRRATSRTRSPRARRPRASRRPSSARPTSSPRSSSATAVYGATIYAVEGTYDDCSRLSVELSFELDWAFVNVGLRSYYAEGSKTVAFEIAEQLGWRLPDGCRLPDRVGCALLEGAPGLLRARGARARRRRRAPPVRRPGRRLRAGRFGLRRGSQGHTRSSPTRSAARSRSAIRPTATSRSRRRRRRTARSTPSPRTRSARTWRSSPRRAASSARRRPGVTLGALREAVQRGELGEEDTVVLLVTGDGLKTPQPVADRVLPILVEPDADLLLERLGVTL